MARTVPCVLDRISGPNLRCTTLRLPFSIGTLALGLERCRVVSVAPQLQNSELQLGCRKDLHIQALKLPSAQACGQITTARGATKIVTHRSTGGTASSSSGTRSSSRVRPGRSPSVDHVANLSTRSQPGRGLILSVFLPSVGNAKAPVRARSGRGAYCNFRYRLPTAGDLVFRAADAVNDLRPLVTARSKGSASLTASSPGTCSTKRST
jgi:hypothetical protein